MGILPASREALLCFFFFLVPLFFAVSFCYANDYKSVFQVIGTGECADCAQSNIKTSQAVSGLRVTIDCKPENGVFKTRGSGELDEEGKFTVYLPNKIVEDGKLKEECYAQLQSVSAIPCPAHDGLHSSKIVFKSKTNGRHTFGLAGKLKFSPVTCASAFFWPHFKYPPLPKGSWPPLPKYKHPKFKLPPLKSFGHPFPSKPLPSLPPPVTFKPLPPKPPIFKKPYPPKSLPLPIKPPPKPPVIKPPPKPPVVPIKTPPKTPVFKPAPAPKVLPPPAPKIFPPKPPVIKKPFPPKPKIFPPKPPLFKPPPIPKILPPPVPIYKPKPKPPIFVKPLPPLPKIPPFYQKPFPPLPKVPLKYFHYPKFGKWPPLPPFSP